MDSTQPQSNTIPSKNWRDDMTMFDRARFVHRLSQVLKQLSPGTVDNVILSTAKNFENAVYSQSVDRNQYTLLFARKYNEIMQRIQIQNSNNQTLSVVGDPISVTMSPQQTQSTSPQVQMVYQQTQNTPTQPTMMMQSQPTITTSQSNQQIQNNPSPNMAMTSQPMTMNQSPSLQQQPYGINQQQLFLTRNTAASANMINRPPMPSVTNPIQQQNINMTQQYQSQVVAGLATQFKLQREQLLQNQLLQLNACNPANLIQLRNIHQRQLQQLHHHYACRMQQIRQQQSSAVDHNQPVMTTMQQQQPVQSNFLAQTQPGMTSIQQPSTQPNIFGQNQSVVTSLQQQLPPKSVQPNLISQTQLAMANVQQQSVQPNVFVRNQPVMTSMQQLDSKSPLQPPQITISVQQRIQAVSMIRQIDENVRINKVQWQPLENLSVQEKKAIWETVAQMRPMYEKLNQLLPLFLAITSSTAATQRLVSMKYLFEDQLNSLRQNIYLLSLERLQAMRNQFAGCFAHVQNAMNGGNTTLMSQSPGQQQQQLNLRQQQPQTSPISRAETPINTATSSPRAHHSPLSTKRDTTDNTLPPSKKQRGTTTTNDQQSTTTTMNQQPTMTMDQQEQQQNLNSTDMPATTNYSSQVINTPSTIPDCAHAMAATETDSPSSTIKNESTSSAGAIQQQQSQPQQQQNPGTILTQNDLQPHVIRQLAISSGIPSDIVAILPAEALKYFWMLHQGSLNRINLPFHQQLQLRQMLDGFILQAKARLGEDNSNSQYQQQQQQQGTPLQPSCAIDLTFSPPPLPVSSSSSTPSSHITTSNTNWAMENSLAEEGLSLPAQDSQKLKYEPAFNTSETANTIGLGTSTANATTISQPTIMSASSVSSNNLQPNATMTNPGLFANDVSTLMTNTSSLTETNTTPLFVMDDFIIDGNSNNNKTDMTVGQSSNINNNNDKNDTPILVSSSTPSSGSSSSLVHVALKEGFKDETFCLNELDSNSLSSSSPNHNNNTTSTITTANNVTSSCLDQSSNASSLSSTSLTSSSELNDDLVKNSWYQMGIDKDSLGITDTIPGLDFDSDSFIGYDSGNRLSHPPLF